GQRLAFPDAGTVGSDCGGVHVTGRHRDGSPFGGRRPAWLAWSVPSGPASPGPRTWVPEQGSSCTLPGSGPPPGVVRIIQASSSYEPTRATAGQAAAAAPARPWDQPRATLTASEAAMPSASI